MNHWFAEADLKHHLAQRAIIGFQRPNRHVDPLCFVLQRSDYLLQMRFKYRLVLGIMGAPMAIRADGHDRIRRVWPPIGQAFDVMHLQVGLMVKCQKRSRSTTPFTLPASPSERV